MPPAELRLPTASGWATPAALSAALALGLCVQFALPAAEPDRALPALNASHGGAFHIALTSATASADGAEALARPPFSPSRGSAEAATSSGTLGLLGLARAGSAALATVQDAAGATQTLRVGDSFQGWRLAAVAGDRAVLAHGGEARTLRVGERAIAAPIGASSPGVPPPTTPSTPGGPT